MKISSKIGKYSLAFAMLIVLSSGAEAAIKCWTNSEGVKECGNSIPPEYSQQGHTELNSHGVVIEESDRAKTAEELELERQQKHLRAKKQQEEKVQAARDRVLLDTFSNEGDILLTRDGQLSAIESQIKLTESHVSKLKANLDKLIKAAGTMERNGIQPSERIIKDIGSVKQQIRENERFIAEKRKEQDEVRKAFAQDIERYRELKGSLASQS